jgi:hypothetical protein
MLRYVENVQFVTQEPISRFTKLKGEHNQGHIPIQRSDLSLYLLSKEATKVLILSISCSSAFLIIFLILPTVHVVNVSKEGSLLISVQYSFARRYTALCNLAEFKVLTISMIEFRYW